MRRLLGILTIGAAWFFFAGLVWVNLPPAPVPAPPLRITSAPAAPCLEKQKSPSFLAEFERRFEVERLLHTSA